MSKRTTEPTAESLKRAQSCFALICEQDVPIDAFEVRHIARAIEEAVAAERKRGQEWWTQQTGSSPRKAGNVAVAQGVRIVGAA